MNEILKTLDSVLGEGKHESYLERIRDIYKKYNFTDRQKRAAEEFLFNPSKESAVSSLEKTPKVSIFLKNYLDEDTLTEELVKILDNRKTSLTYIKGLERMKGLGDTVEIVFERTSNERAKIYYMEKIVRDCGM